MIKHQCGNVRVTGAFLPCLRSNRQLSFYFLSLNSESRGRGHWGARTSSSAEGSPRCSRLSTSIPHTRHEPSHGELSTETDRGRLRHLAQSLTLLVVQDGDHEVQDGGVCPRDIHLGERMWVWRCVTVSVPCNRRTPRTSSRPPSRWPT